MIPKKVLFAFSLTITLLSALIVSSSHATTKDETTYSRNQIKQIIIEEAMNSIVPPSLALAVAKVESDFNANALSSAGARGVMQIMPRTARDEFGIVQDELWNARLNIQLGIDYLAQLHHQYGGRWILALSHYNGGTLKGHGRNARPHRYTRQYVRSVRRWWRRYKDQSSIWMTASADNKLRRRDGWNPARTRVKELLRQSLKKYKRTLSSSNSRANRGWRSKSENSLKPSYSDRTYRPYHKQKWQSWRFFGEELDDGFDKNFFRRLERAKKELDDFGPSFRSKRS